MKREALGWVGEMLAVLVIVWLLVRAFGWAMALDEERCAEFERLTGLPDAEVAR